MNFMIQSAKGTYILSPSALQHILASTGELTILLIYCSDDNVSLSDPESETDAGESGSEEVRKETGDTLV